ncbi:MAG: AAA family ATPase [Alphaproteobacteria bacterium]|nr:AAA family ATPase [Alphaproteobacteria bacterium]
MPEPWRTRRDLNPVIPATGLKGRDGTYHAEPDLVRAANVALTLRRPLLLTGEPGCGKTDFAYAVAHALKGDADAEDGALLECHVRSDSRAADLLYHYDALRRFGDAHFGDKEKAAEVRDYIRLLPLGQALHARERRVVLIDEVDKAPRDLPNDLLRELDHGRFVIPEIPVDAPPHPSGLTREMGRPQGDPSRPMVIITSNAERQLPDPFLRRCVFFRIPFPSLDTLTKILEDRCGGPDPMHRSATAIFLGMRRVADLTKKPATSELIDWVDALRQVYVRDEVQPALTGFAALVRGAGARLEGLPWKTLPALTCLLKLHEDLERVHAG